MLKQVFLLFTGLIISVQIANSQNFNSGGWSTSNATRYTRITATNNLENKLYQIECTNLVDNDILKFNVIVDGVTLPFSLFEGSYVAVEGKNVAIQQVTAGKMIKGSWRVLQQPEIQVTILPWSYVSKVNEDMLIASLKTEQEFLLSINSSSTNCTNTSMSVIIDGQPIRDANKIVLNFWEGSTIYAKVKINSYSSKWYLC